MSDEYVVYLSQYDKHIAYNKLEKRPYIGVVLEVRGKHYFAPMFSPKIKHKTYFDIDTKRYGYKRLIEEQYSYINMTNNIIKIKEMASSLYDRVMSN